MLDLTEEAKYDTTVKAKTINDAMKKAIECVAEIQSKGYKVNYISIVPDEYAKKSYCIEITGLK